MQKNSEKSAEEARSRESEASGEAPANAMVPVYWMAGFVVIVVVLYLIGQGG